jgi:hypothetical protein
MDQHKNVIYRGWNQEKAVISSPPDAIDGSDLVLTVNNFTMRMQYGNLVSETGTRPPDFSRLFQIVHRYSVSFVS